MIGERKDNFDETEYGSLAMRPYNISGNAMDAFYDSNDDLVFVLDKTINESKPNVLLVINPDGDKKWDEILASGYGVDLEYVRPKQDNKYQKLDIEYSGLSVYDNLIRAYVAGDSIDENLVQLNVLRNSAARHSAMERLNAANEIIVRTNATIVKTKESIVRLQTRLKTLRAKLADLKKEVGRVAPKQSAAKILKTESQIDTTKEKIKRAQKRLESAEKRLETATIDAQLAGDLLNQPDMEIKQIVKNKPVMVAPKHEIQTIAPNDESDEENIDNVFDDAPDDEPEEYEMDIKEPAENEVKPLFDQDPEIMDDNIAFKPINFESSDLPVAAPAPSAPAFPATLAIPDDNQQAGADIKNDEKNDEFTEKSEQPESVLESLTPVMNEPLTVEPVIDEPIEHEEIKEEATSDFQDEVFDAPSYDESQKTDSENESSANDVAPIDVKPVPMDEGARPAAPIVSNSDKAAPVAVVGYDNTKSKSSFLYYMLLLILIGLSVFALWAYQKRMGNIKPILSVGNPEEIVNVENTNVVTTGAVVQSDDVFVDEPEQLPETPAPVDVEPVEEPMVEDNEPFIMDAVSEKISAFSTVAEPEYTEQDENDIVYEPVVNKPVYDAGARHDDMFVYEEEVPADDSEYDEEYSEPVGYYSETVQPVYYQETDQDMEYNDVFVDDVVYDASEYNSVISPDVVYQNDVYDDYDPEEAAYQAGDDGYDEYR